MLAILVTCGDRNQVVMSAKGNVKLMIESFLKETFGLNDESVKGMTYTTLGDGGFFCGDFICHDYRGTVKSLKLITC